jgi:hypothetical protein
MQRGGPALAHIVLKALRSGQSSALPAGKLALVLAPAPDFPGVGVFRVGSDGQLHRPSAFRLEFGAIFNETSNEATQLRIFDTHERLCQGRSVGSGEKIVHVGGSFGRPGWPSRDALKKEGNRHLKDLGYVLQAAGTDAVHSLLIFLHLLERETKRVAELFLANAQHHSAHTHAASHMLVDSEIDVLCHIHHTGNVHSVCAIREAANAAERPMFPASSYALRSRQFGHPSAPMIPHFLHTIRGPNTGTGTSSGHGAALMIVVA